MKKILLASWLVATLVGCGARGASNGPTIVPGSGTPSPESSTKTIEITVEGFSPPTLTIKRGTTVAWLNRDHQTHWIAVDPYPIHTDLAGFDSGRPLEAGENYQFTFTKNGEWSYHDHLRPITYTGVVTVTD